MRRATSLIQVCITHFWNKNFVRFTFHYFSIGEDVDHANIIFRTGSRATYRVFAGDLAPAGTTLVTPDIDIPIQTILAVQSFVLNKLTVNAWGSFIQQLFLP